MMDSPSLFFAIFPYAFIAAFPIFGIIVVTKLELASKRAKRKRLQNLRS